MNIEQTQKPVAGKPIMLELFWARSSSIQYVFRDGRYARFADFKFYTNHPGHIAELKDEIANGHPSLYQDDSKQTVELNEDPIAGLKAKLREEIIAEEKTKALAISGTTTRDMGTTEAVVFTPLNTADVASGMADSTGNAVAEFLQTSTVNPAIASGLAKLSSTKK